MAGRKAGFRHSEETRAKIKAGNLITRLYKIAMGEVEADATHINAAKTLLNKVLPDLKAVDHTGEVDVNSTVTNITREFVNAPTPDS